MAARKKKKKTSGIPAWFWLIGGILIGLGAAVALMIKGYLPEIQQHTPAVNKPAKESEEALLNDSPAEPEPRKPTYDFFTVLPEMEVVVPEQELKRKATRVTESSNPAAGPDNQDSYVLQVASFKSAAEAEQMKARLALTGSTAYIQTVTIDDQTWHRVRIGPFKGAPKAEEMRSMLADNEIDTLVIKVNP